MVSFLIGGNLSSRIQIPRGFGGSDFHNSAIPPENEASAITAKISFFPPRGVFRSSIRFDFSQKRTHISDLSVPFVLSFHPSPIPKSQFAFPLSQGKGGGSWAFPSSKEGVVFPLSSPHCPIWPPERGFLFAFPPLVGGVALLIAKIDIFCIHFFYPLMGSLGPKEPNDILLSGCRVSPPDGNKLFSKLTAARRAAYVSRLEKCCVCKCFARCNKKCFF